MATTEDTSSELDNEIEERLKALITGSGRDLDWAIERYEQKLTEAKDRVTPFSREGSIRDSAIGMLRAEINQGERTSSSVEKVDILAIGHTGVQSWNDPEVESGEKEVLVCFGVVNPPDKRLGLGSFIVEEPHGVDIPGIRQKFSTLNNLEGWFSVRESDQIPGHYTLNSTEETKVESVESDMEPMEKRDFLHGFVEDEDEAKIQSIAQYMSMKNSEGYTANFGSDIKRIQGSVVDYVGFDDFNIYTVMDDSIVNPENLPENVVSEKGRSPGLTVYCPDDFFKYGAESQLEFYGAIETNDEGQTIMRACGIVPLIPMEMDDQSAPDQDSDPSVSEQQI